MIFPRNVSLGYPSCNVRCTLYIIDWYQNTGLWFGQNFLIPASSLTNFSYFFAFLECRTKQIAYVFSVFQTMLNYPTRRNCWQKYSKLLLQPIRFANFAIIQTEGFGRHFRIGLVVFINAPTIENGNHGFAKYFSRSCNIVYNKNLD